MTQQEWNSYALANETINREQEDAEYRNQVRIQKEQKLADKAKEKADRLAWVPTYNQANVPVEWRGQGADSDSSTTTRTNRYDATEVPHYDVETTGTPDNDRKKVYTTLANARGTIAPAVVNEVDNQTLAYQADEEYRNSPQFQIDKQNAGKDDAYYNSPTLGQAVTKYRQNGEMGNEPLNAFDYYAAGEFNQNEALRDAVEHPDSAYYLGNKTGEKGAFGRDMVDYKVDPKDGTVFNERMIRAGYGVPSMKLRENATPAEVAEEKLRYEKLVKLMNEAKAKGLGNWGDTGADPRLLQAQQDTAFSQRQYSGNFSTMGYAPSTWDNIKDIPGGAAAGLVEGAMDLVDGVGKLGAKGVNAVAGTDFSGEVFGDKNIQDASNAISEALGVDPKDKQWREAQTQALMERAFGEVDITKPSTYSNADMGAVADLLIESIKDPTMAAHSLTYMGGSGIGYGTAVKTGAKVAAKVAARKVAKEAGKDVAKLETRLANVAGGKYSMQIGYAFASANQIDNDYAKNNDGEHMGLARYVGTVVGSGVMAFPEVAAMKFGLGAGVPNAAVEGVFGKAKQAVVQIFKGFAFETAQESAEQAFQAAISKFGTDEYKGKSFGEVLADSTTEILGAGTVAGPSSVHFAAAGKAYSKTKEALAGSPKVEDKKDDVVETKPEKKHDKASASESLTMAVGKLKESLDAGDLASAIDAANVAFKYKTILNSVHKVKADDEVFKQYIVEVTRYRAKMMEQDKKTVKSKVVLGSSKADLPEGSVSLDYMVDRYLEQDDTEEGKNNQKQMMANIMAAVNSEENLKADNTITKEDVNKIINKKRNMNIAESSSTYVEDALELKRAQKAAESSSDAKERAKSVKEAEKTANTIVTRVMTNLKNKKGVAASRKAAVDALDTVYDSDADGVAVTDATSAEDMLVIKLNEVNNIIETFESKSDAEKMMSKLRMGKLLFGAKNKGALVKIQDITGTDNDLDAFKELKAIIELKQAHMNGDTDAKSELAAKTDALVNSSDDFAAVKVAIDTGLVKQESLAATKKQLAEEVKQKQEENKRLEKIINNSTKSEEGKKKNEKVIARVDKQIKQNNAATAIVRSIEHGNATDELSAIAKEKDGLRSKLADIKKLMGSSKVAKMFTGDSRDSQLHATKKHSAHNPIRFKNKEGKYEYTSEALKELRSKVIPAIDAQIKKDEASVKAIGTPATDAQKKSLAKYKEHLTNSKKAKAETEAIIEKLTSAMKREYQAYASTDDVTKVVLSHKNRIAGIKTKQKAQEELLKRLPTSREAWVKTTVGAAVWKGIVAKGQEAIDKKEAEFEENKAKVAEIKATQESLKQDLEVAQSLMSEYAKTTQMLTDLEGLRGLEAEEFASKEVEEQITSISERVKGYVDNYRHDLKVLLGGVDGRELTLLGKDIGQEGVDTLIKYSNMSNEERKADMEITTEFNRILNDNVHKRKDKLAITDIRDITGIRPSIYSVDGIQEMMKNGFAGHEKEETLNKLKSAIKRIQTVKGDETKDFGAYNKDRMFYFAGESHVSKAAMDLADNVAIKELQEVGQELDVLTNKIAVVQEKIDNNNAAKKRVLAKLDKNDKLSADEKQTKRDSLYAINDKANATLKAKKEALLEDKKELYAKRDNIKLNRDRSVDDVKAELLDNNVVVDVVRRANKDTEVKDVSDILAVKGELTDVMQAKIEGTALAPWLAKEAKKLARLMTKTVTKEVKGKKTETMYIRDGHTEKDYSAQLLLQKDEADGQYTVNQHAMLALESVWADFSQNDLLGLISNDAEAIDNMIAGLGYQVDDAKKAELKQELSHGAMLKNVVPTLGKAAVKRMGLKEVKDLIDQYGMPQVEASLGYRVLQIGIDRGVIEAHTNTKDAKDVAYAYLHDDGKTRTPMVKLTGKDENARKKVAEREGEMPINTILSDVYGNKYPKKKQQYMKPMKEDTKVHNSILGLDIDENTLAVVKAEQQTPYKELTEVAEELMDMYEDGTGEMVAAMGYMTEEEMSGMEPGLKAAQISKNEGIIKEVESLQRHTEARKQGLVPQVMYFLHKILGNGRDMINSNEIDPQNRKLHRFAVVPERSIKDVTISLRKDGSVDGAYTDPVTASTMFALAQAMGVGIDKIYPEESIAIGKALYKYAMERGADKLKQVVLSGDKEEQEWILGEAAEEFRTETIVRIRAMEHLSSEEKKALIKKASVMKTKKLEVEEISHTVQAIVALRNFKANDGKGKNIALQLEYDGINNGSASKFLQFMANMSYVNKDEPMYSTDQKGNVIISKSGVEHIAKVKKQLERTGMYDGSKDVVNTITHNLDNGIADSYVDLSENMDYDNTALKNNGVKKMMADKDFSDAFMSEVDSVGKDESVIAKMKREIAKYIYMPFGYGQKIKSAIEKVANDSLETKFRQGFWEVITSGSEADAKKHKYYVLLKPVFDAWMKNSIYKDKSWDKFAKIIRTKVEEGGDFGFAAVTFNSLGIDASDDIGVSKMGDSSKLVASLEAQVEDLKTQIDLFTEVNQVNKFKKDLKAVQAKLERAQKDVGTVSSKRSILEIYKTVLKEGKGENIAKSLSMSQQHHIDANRRMNNSFRAVTQVMNTMIERSVSNMQKEMKAKGKVLTAADNRYIVNNVVERIKPVFKALGGFEVGIVDTDTMNVEGEEVQVGTNPTKTGQSTVTVQITKKGMVNANSAGSALPTQNVDASTQAGMVASLKINVEEGQEIDFTNIFDAAVADVVNAAVLSKTSNAEYANVHQNMDMSLVALQMLESVLSFNDAETYAAVDKAFKDGVKDYTTVKSSNTEDRPGNVYGEEKNKVMTLKNVYDEMYEYVRNNIANKVYAIGEDGIHVLQYPFADGIAGMSGRGKIDVPGGFKPGHVQTRNGEVMVSAAGIDSMLDSLTDGAGIKTFEELITDKESMTNMNPNDLPSQISAAKAAKKVAELHDSVLKPYYELITEFLGSSTDGKTFGKTPKAVTSKMAKELYARFSEEEISEEDFGNSAMNDTDTAEIKAAYEAIQDIMLDTKGKKCKT